MCQLVAFSVAFAARAIGGTPWTHQVREFGVGSTTIPGQGWPGGRL